MVLAVGLLLAATSRSLAQELDAEKIAKFKAAYLLNFVRFTEWPADAFGSDQSPIVVTIVGRTAVSDVLEQLAQTEAVQHRRIEVRRASYPEPGPDGVITDEEVTSFYDHLRQSHMLYIDDSQSMRIRDILGQVRNNPVLTVSDAAKFCEGGGMLALAVRQNRVQFDANPQAIEKARVKVSSKVLRLARIVATEDG
jgi:hypothetical protein